MTRDVILKYSVGWQNKYRLWSYLVLAQITLLQFFSFLCYLSLSAFLSLLSMIRVLLALVRWVCRSDGRSRLLDASRWICDIVNVVLVQQSGVSFAVLNIDVFSQCGLEVHKLFIKYSYVIYTKEMFILLPTVLRSYSQFTYGKIKNIFFSRCAHLYL